MQKLLFPLVSIIHICKSYGIRVIIDVKNTTIRKYKGANILKPNLQELSFLTKKPVKNIEERILNQYKGKNNEPE